MVPTVQDVRRGDSGRRTRRRRGLCWIGAVILVLVLAFFAGGGW